MTLTSPCFFSLGTLKTAFSMLAFTWSDLKFSGNLNFLLFLSMWCHCHTSFWFLLPLVHRTLTSSSSASIITSSFFSPRRCHFKMWASRGSLVSLQSIRMLVKADVSPAKEEAVARMGRHWKGPKCRVRRGKKILIHWLPKMLGIKDIFAGFWIKIKWWLIRE